MVPEFCTPTHHQLVQLAVSLVPYEDMAAVRAADNVLVIRTEEVTPLDSLDIAVSAVTPADRSKALLMRPLRGRRDCCCCGLVVTFMIV